jgi:hypothetical protein
MQLSARINWVLSRPPFADEALKAVDAFSATSVNGISNQK